MATIRNGAKTIFLLIFFVSFPYACDTYDSKVYDSFHMDSISSFIVLNFSAIKQELMHSQEEYTSSLIFQLRNAGASKNYSELKNLLNENSDAYNFSVSLTKDLN